MVAPVQVFMAEVWVYNASAHIPLARIYSHDHTELQWSMRNIISSSRKMSSLTLRWLVVLAIGILPFWPSQKSPQKPNKQNHMNILE